jgi:hypothetical protein
MTPDWQDYMTPRKPAPAWPWWIVAALLCGFWGWMLAAWVM